ncbi:hypothetical protein KQX54_020541 [Cotesia glomerata]|uniref:Uncharacterized protein n=1 Tax=Cotesia glomerata TaxID=32391 RepID=A0AAV7I2F8_COTGL|nr:hypothetical protein KQX54_020541 [Cotesia glomerata]
MYEIPVDRQTIPEYLAVYLPLRSLNMKVFRVPKYAGLKLLSETCLWFIGFFPEKQIGRSDSLGVGADIAGQIYCCDRLGNEKSITKSNWACLQKSCRGGGSPGIRTMTNCKVTYSRNPDPESHLVAFNLVQLDPILDCLNELNLKIELFTGHGRIRNPVPPLTRNVG